MQSPRLDRAFDLYNAGRAPAAAPPNPYYVAQPQQVQYPPQQQIQYPPPQPPQQQLQFSPPQQPLQPLQPLQPTADKHAKRLKKVDDKILRLTEAVVRMGKQRARGTAPPLPPADSGTQLVLCAGLFLLLLAVLIVALVHMVKTDGAINLLLRDQDHMRQWMQKFGGHSGNAPPS